ncbi:MAG: type 1 glutamine amidotransferase [Gammaproteobacteria bacterium]
MSKTIVFIDHHENIMDDLAWTHLGQLGFERRLICPFKGEAIDVSADEIWGTVIYGGSQNVGEQTEHPFLKQELDWITQCIGQDLPTLGLCLGGQLIAHALGAPVGPRKPIECEFGYYPITPTAHGDNWIPDTLHTTQAHYEEFALPDGAIHLAESERFPNQAFRYQENVIGLQFHPEVTATIFRRWQNAEWAMFDVDGAQTREQQDALLEQHDAAQGAWFKQTLETLFGNPEVRESADNPN